MHINILFCALDGVTLPVLKMVRGWGCRNVSVWMDRHAARQRCALPMLSKKLVDDNLSMDNSVVYYEWRSDRCGVECVSEIPIKSAVCRMRMQCPSCFVMIGSVPRPHNRFVGFVDADHRDDLPDVFHVAAWFDNCEDLFDFCERHGAFVFDIQNTGRYQRTQRTEMGGPVFRDTATGNYVYLDRFHRTHYEVFDSNGIHLGEMTLDGALNRAKADGLKHFMP